MKILALANHAYVIHKFRYELLISLLEDGNEVFMSCPYDNILDDLIGKGCTFLPVNFDRHGRNPFDELGLMAYYYKKMRSIKPDVILTYTIKPNIYGGLVASFLKIPYIATITGLSTAMNKATVTSFIAQKMLKFALKHARKVCFQNQDNLRFMLRQSIVKDNYLLVNGSGVNLEQFSYMDYPSDDKTVRFLFVGRLMSEKGIIELCEAAKVIFANGYINAEFTVIGFCETDFKQELEKLSLTPNIHFFGVQNDVRPFIASAHAIVLPSYQEGMSNALLEAASCGRPLIATNIPGCKEIVDDGTTGLLVKPKDTSSLLSALETFMDLPYAEKKQMGIKGRKKMEKCFDRGITVSQYKKIIYGEVA